MATCGLQPLSPLQSFPGGAGCDGVGVVEVGGLFAGGTGLDTGVETGEAGEDGEIVETDGVLETVPEPLALKIPAAIPAAAVPRPIRIQRLWLFP
jgi:hypothetical protein